MAGAGATRRAAPGRSGDAGAAVLLHASPQGVAETVRFRWAAHPFRRSEAASCPVPGLPMMTPRLSAPPQGTRRDRELRRRRRPGVPRNRPHTQRADSARGGGSLGRPGPAHRERRALRHGTVSGGVATVTHAYASSSGSPYTISAGYSGYADFAPSTPRSGDAHRDRHPRHHGTYPADRDSRRRHGLHDVQSAAEGDPHGHRPLQRRRQLLVLLRVPPRRCPLVRGSPAAPTGGPPPRRARPRPPRAAGTSVSP